MDPDTGAITEDKDNFLIETDGTALMKVMAVEGVDFKRTYTNNVVEILTVLGIEATRKALINELQLILGSYSIYVNSRHIQVLVDMMTLRGHLTAITRHGINRVDTGALKKCTFEETTEILLEAAFFGEHDPLSGISENIIFGQMAPYGTGSFDLVVDVNAIRKCKEPGIDMYQVDQISDETPIQSGYGGRGMLTPAVGKTPDPLDYSNDAMQTPVIDFNAGMTPIQPLSSMSPYPGMGGAGMSSSHYQ